MERITFEGNFCDISMCRENPCPYNGMCSQRQTWERLKEYEETGLEPEKIADFMKRWERAVEIAGLCKMGGIDHLLELKKAEQNGQLVVIPWVAGDVIYEADPAHGVVKHTFAGEPAWMMHSYAVDDAGNEWYDGWGSSDETPFYKTREEAEAALALKGGEGE